MSLYLSASSIADFIKCPQKVLYRFEKPFPEVPSREMTIGKIAHSAIERGWKNKAIAFEIVDSGVKHNNLTKADQSHLQFMVELFFNNFRHLVGDGDLVEYKFKIPLYDDVFIVGKMDRISKGNIYDWKTDARPPTKLYSNVQCMIYDYAFQRIFENRPSSICIASLTKGILIPYAEDKLYTEELFRNIIPRMIKTVKDKSYERLGLFNHSCYRCPYKLGCLGKGEGTNELDNPTFTE